MLLSQGRDASPPAHPPTMEARSLAIFAAAVISSACGGAGRESGSRILEYLTPEASGAGLIAPLPIRYDARSTLADRTSRAGQSTRRKTREKDVPVVMKRLYDAASKANEAGDDSFPSYDVVRALEDRSGNGNRLLYRFDVSSIDVNRESVVRADFYVFKRRVQAANHSPSNLPLIKLRLYQVIDESRLFHANGSVNAGTGAKFLAAKQVAAHFQEGAHFQESNAILSAVKDWIRHPETNHGLVMVVTGAHDMPLEAASSFFVSGSDKDAGGRQPVLVTYGRLSDESKLEESFPVHRFRREAKGETPPLPVASKSACLEGGTSPGGRRKCAGTKGSAGFGSRIRMRAKYRDGEFKQSFAAKTSDRNSSSGGSGLEDTSAGSSEATARRNASQGWRGVSRPDDSASGESGETARSTRTHLAEDESSSPEEPGAICARRPFYLSFEDLGMAEFILAPQGLHVNRCSGVCPQPLTRLASTNHAILMSLASYMNLSHGAAGPCCVPNRLGVASVLYSSDDGEVTLRNYDSMLVESCTCR